MSGRVDGVVTAVFGPLVRVQVGDETLVLPFRRRLRFHGDEVDTRLVVGDHVVLEGRASQQVVSEVKARHGSLLRRSPGEDRPRVIAANVDQAVVIMAAASPEPNPRLLDRLLVACHHAGIAPVVCVNKVDQGMSAAETWLPDYQDAGYPIVLVSARTMRGLGGLQRLIDHRTTLFCGPSGVGKSALLNAIHPGYRLREGSISEATGKGRHTTSSAQLLALPGGGFVVDTPGVREFGLWDLRPDQLIDCFPDLGRSAQQCAYAGCTHDADEGCAVRDAVQAGRLSSRRYTSYLKLQRELAAAAAGQRPRAGH
ncbi:MAG: rsgA [Acidobacteria bacterium]|nr:rsgA [Acidobacteriota bacterium]